MTFVMSGFMRHLKIFIYILWMFGLSALAKPVEVCDLLNNLANQGEGRHTIRARLQVNKYHGHIFLEDVDGKGICPTPKDSVRHDWYPAINVRWFDALMAENVTVGKNDEARKAIEDVMRDPKTNIGFDVVVVLEGQVSVNLFARFWRSPGGKVLGTGFGLEGGFPCEIKVERILGIEGSIRRSGR